MSVAWPEETAPAGYRIQDTESLSATLDQWPDVAERLGGGSGEWRVEEVGDGNLNLVFKVRGPDGGVVVKQALPYVRLVGESWPLPLSRAHFEHLALREEARHAPGLVPEIYHYDEAMALIVMELLEPHIIMRHGMIAGTEYPRFVEDLSHFTARSLFFTSDLALPADEKKQLIADFAGNSALCKITEDLIFTEPYMIAENNRWTSPYLDSYAASVREDRALKVAISRLKLKFMSSAEALLHGDLHTGSIMLTQEDTRVIDPEFAFVGPMGFDLGAVMGNLLLSYFSQDGHETTPGDRDGYRGWILNAMESYWQRFREEFLALWRAPEHAKGDAYPAALFEAPADAERLDSEREAYMDRLLVESLGFAGAKMTRRILGLAHNIDLEWIEDPRLRAICEARALMLARRLMVDLPANKDFSGIEEVSQAARGLRRWQPTFA